MASGYRLGVDLGTTYTAAATERDGRVEVCTFGDRTTVIPSLALVRPSGEIVRAGPVGRRVSEIPATYPGSYVLRFSAARAEATNEIPFTLS